MNKKKIEFIKYDEKTGQQLIWDASSLDKLLACEYLYFLSVIENYRKEGYSEIHANWGKAYHSAQEVIHDALFYGISHQDAMLLGLRECLQWRDLLVAPEGTKPITNKTTNTLLQSVIGYCDKYKDGMLDTVILPSGQPATEFRFEFHIPNTDYRCSGYIDRLVQLDHFVVPLDYKTTKNTLGSYYFADFQPNIQVYIYLYFLRHVLGLPAEFFMVDAVQVLVNGSRFDRHRVFVPDENLTNFVEVQLPIYFERAEKCLETGVWPQRFTSCGLYGSCDFRKICSKGLSEHGEELRLQGFEKKDRERSRVSK